MGGRRCVARVWDAHTPVSRQCSNRATHGDCCGVHDPDRLAKKHAETEARWRREDEERRVRKAAERENSPEARVRAIRAVVAAQWGVAVAFASCRCGCGTPRIVDPDEAAPIADLPTAEQIVDGTA
jgi:hypothetical protein